MSFCKDCVRGVTHEGTPEGKIKTVYGVRVYIATPTVDYPKDKAILFLPDIFGLDLINAQLLADDFARNGFLTIIPDYFNNDPAPADGLNPGSKFNLEAWFMNHGNEETRPPLDRVLRWIEDEGITGLGATGYCFGARYALNLSFESLVKATVISHPSLLNLPGDLETYQTLSIAPLLINSCTYDQQFPLESQRLADQYLGNGRYRPGYKRLHFEGCSHGFAVRGDLNDPKVKAGKEGAFNAAVEWFFKYL